MISNGNTQKKPENATSDSSGIERFTLEHIGKYVGLSNPRISPDGSSIVLSVSRVNYDENRFDMELVQVDVASASRKVLTRRNIWQVRWSPSGKKLAFLTNGDDKSQIFVMPIDGGEAIQVSHAPMGVDSYSWRPDGEAFAYIMKDEPEEVEGPERHNRSFEADVNYLLREAPRSYHFWLLPVKGGEAKRLTSGEWSVNGDFAWSPDGKEIAFGWQPKPGPRYILDVKVQILNVETGSIRRLNDCNHRMSNVAYSPDGKYISYHYPHDGDSRYGNDVFIAPAEGGEGQSLTPDLDRNVMVSRWVPDSDSLLFYAFDSTVMALWLQSIEDSRKRLEVGKAIVGPGYTISRTGKIALLAYETYLPAELYIMETPESLPRRLTDFNTEIAALDLGEQETIRWRGADDFDMDGVLTYPPDYQPGKAYPLVLYIHGGPKNTSYIGFSSRTQLLASNGWVVFQPNYRGSDNLGHEYTAAICNDAGEGPGRDVMSGVELLIEKGIADPSRIAVSGWSYGGFMTTWLLGNYPDRWRAGVVGDAVTDHLDQYVLSDIHSEVATYFEGSPFTSPEILQTYREQTPITYAVNIKAPTLILHNTGDQRVPITESFVLYHTLRDKGVKTKFIAYPISGHETSDPVHQRDLDRRLVAWIKEHIDSPLSILKVR
ncbi:S9 family peptidase [Candidatus Bathyarchaeota archaeon]|nr:S9 family peptidase [Candidatus Bathyarchaeota archaeon]